MHYANTKHTNQTERHSDFLGVLMAPCSSEALTARAASTTENGHSPAVTNSEPLTHGTSLCQRNRKSLPGDTACFLKHHYLTSGSCYTRYQRDLN